MTDPIRCIAIFFLILVTSCQPETKTDEMTTYYFIRHAEKDTSNPQNEDPELTEEGKNRVRIWREVFKEVPLDLVYSSHYKRTRETARPIARDHGLEVVPYNTKKLNDRDFQENTKGKTVLVVGHSDLNPEWVNYLIEEEKYSDIPQNESGSVFIVTLSPGGEKTSHVLYINPGS